MINNEGQNNEYQINEYQDVEIKNNGNAYIEINFEEKQNDIAYIQLINEYNYIHRCLKKTKRVRKNIIAFQIIFYILISNIINYEIYQLFNGYYFMLLIAICCFNSILLIIAIITLYDIINDFMYFYYFNYFNNKNVLDVRGYKINENDEHIKYKYVIFGYECYTNDIIINLEKTYLIKNKISHFMQECDDFEKLSLKINSDDQCPGIIKYGKSARYNYKAKYQKCSFSSFIKTFIFPHALNTSYKKYYLNKYFNMILVK